MSQLTSLILFVVFIAQSSSLLPPIFQWKIIDYSWELPESKTAALSKGVYIPTNNMPTGLARWKDKLFITIPRWKEGVPSSLNFVYLNGSQEQPLNPYPNWQEGSLSCCGRLCSNRTVVSTFRVHIDKCDRLWVVDNGVDAITTGVKRVAPPAIMVFDLTTDQLIIKHTLQKNVLRDSSVLTSIVVELSSKNCNPKECTKTCPTFAYITDMGSNALIVYDSENDEAWRVESPHFHFDPLAGVYKVGGIDFYWSDGVSSAAITPMRKDGYSDLYFQPTSSTKLFKMDTRLLRDKTIPPKEVLDGIMVVGDRGPKSQVTACDIDPKTNVLFYSQVCKNGLGCWNLDRTFNEENTPVIFRDCNLMEFPNDIKVDKQGNLWILSDRQSRFLYESMDYNDVNFRVLKAPVSVLIRDTACGKKNWFRRSSAKEL